MLGINDKNSRMKELAEFILVIIIMSIYMQLVLYLISTTKRLSFVSFILMSIIPAPFIVLGIRIGIKYNILSIIVSSIIIGILNDIYTGLFILVVFMPLSIVLTYLLKNKKTSHEILVISMIVSLISFLIVVKLTVKMPETSVINQISKNIIQSFRMQVSELKDLTKEKINNMDLSNYEKYIIESLFKNTFDYLFIITPSIMIICSLFISYLNFLISSIVLRKMGYKIFSVPRFSYFKLPGNVLLGMIIIFIGTSLLKNFEIFNYETIFINITILATFMFFLQGLAVVFYLLNKGRLIKIFSILLVVVAIILITPLGGFISMLGLLDGIFNFRRIQNDI